MLNIRVLCYYTFTCDGHLATYKLQGRIIGRLSLTPVCYTPTKLLMEQAEMHVGS